MDIGIAYTNALVFTCVEVRHGVQPHLIRCPRGRRVVDDNAATGAGEVLGNRGTQPAACSLPDGVNTERIRGAVVIVVVAAAVVVVVWVSEGDSWSEQSEYLLSLVTIASVQCEP